MKKVVDKAKKIWYINLAVAKTTTNHESDEQVTKVTKNLDNWTVNKPWKIQWVNFVSAKCRCELLWNFKEPLKTVNSDLSEWTTSQIFWQD